MEEKINYDKLTEIVYNFIYDESGNYLDFKEIIELEKLINIVLDNTPDIVDMKYKNKVSMEKSLKYVHDFFASFNEEYAKKFEIMNDEKTIKTYKELCNSETMDDLDDPFTSYLDDKKIIYLPDNRTIVNVYSLAHEFMHYLNMSENGMYNPSYDIFTEMISFVAELLLSDYFANQKFYKHDHKLVQIESFAVIKNFASHMQLELFLCKEVYSKGYIDKMSIYELLELLDNKDINQTLEDIKDCLEDILLNGFKYYDLEGYILGAIVGSYIHQKILDNPKYIKQFIDLNDCFPKLTIQQVFNYLDIDYDKQIKDKDYKILEKSYQKEIKRLW